MLFIKSYGRLIPILEFLEGISKKEFGVAVSAAITSQSSQWQPIHCVNISCAMEKYCASYFLFIVKSFLNVSCTGFIARARDLALHRPTLH